MSKVLDIARVATTFMSAHMFRVLDSTHTHLYHFMECISSDCETLISYKSSNLEI